MSKLKTNLLLIYELKNSKKSLEQYIFSPISNSITILKFPQGCIIVWFCNGYHSYSSRIDINDPDRLPFAMDTACNLGDQWQPIYLTSGR